MKPKLSVTITVEVDSDWIDFAIDFAIDNDDLFRTDYCGQWARGMVYAKKRGWLVHEHGDEVESPEHIPMDVLRAWRNGKKLPARWHRFDRDAAVRAFAEGVRRYGAGWYDDRAETDANTYDALMQIAVLGEVRYR